MKDLRITRIVKNIKFQEVWNELNANNSFQRQFAKFSLVIYVFKTAPIVKIVIFSIEFTFSF